MNNATLVRFDPSLEQLTANEGETRATLQVAMRSIADSTSRDYGHAFRSVHAKSYALLGGELTVLDGLPPELAQGLFDHPANYPAVLLFSTKPGGILDDAVSAPRGLALKVIGVEGGRLPDADAGMTQDFVLANGPAFSTLPDVSPARGLMAEPQAEIHLGKPQREFVRDSHTSALCD